MFVRNRDRIWFVLTNAELCRTVRNGVPIWPPTVAFYDRMTRSLQKKRKNFFPSMSLPNFVMWGVGTFHPVWTLGGGGPNWMSKLKESLTWMSIPNIFQLHPRLRSKLFFSTPPFHGLCHFYFFQALKELVTQYPGKITLIKLGKHTTLSQLISWFCSQMQTSM